MPLVHFKLGNIDIADSLLRSAGRHPASSSDSAHHEVGVIRHLTRITVCPEAEQRLKPGDPHEEPGAIAQQGTIGQLLDLYEITSWVEARARN